MRDPIIVAGGRPIPDAFDRIRRYCGLPWSGGERETWAWAYYDEIPTAHDNRVTPTDVVSAGALHPGLSREELTWFNARQADLQRWLQALPPGLDLAKASPPTVARVTSMPDALDGISVTLLSKVLHRKRPDLLPLLDRHIIDWYRPVTGARSAGQAWPLIVEAMHAEQAAQDRTGVLLALQALRDERGGRRRELRISWLRAVDIAIWMGAR